MSGRPGEHCQDATKNSSFSRETPTAVDFLYTSLTVLGGFLTQFRMQVATVEQIAHSQVGLKTKSSSPKTSDPLLFCGFPEVPELGIGTA